MVTCSVHRVLLAIWNLFVKKLYILTGYFSNVFCQRFNSIFFLYILEYKKIVDRVVGLTHLNLNRMKLGSETWGQQFRNAMSVNGGDIENATSSDYFMHFVTFPWKVRVT